MLAVLLRTDAPLTGRQIHGMLMIARGEATVDSDIDLAVIADPDWPGQVKLEDTVHTRLGNDCNVLAFTSAEFTKVAHDDEPVVSDILRHGIALIGDKPRVRMGAA